MRSVDTIMSYFHTRVENKEIIAPHEWIDGAQMANVLMGDETDKLFDLQQQVAEIKAEQIKVGDSVAKAKAFVETTLFYKDYCKQKAKIDQVIEFIRISKLQARLKNEEFKNY